jgi:uncharacterized protein
LKVYKKRIADRILKEKLDAKGAVLVEGAKWCGKTTTASQIAQSILFLHDPANKEHYLKMASISPGLLLEGATPRLIDEWQLAPQLWDAIRFEIDQRDEFGQFILTGSSTPVADMSTSHSGTGRISRMIMRPMTLWESGDSNGKVSLSDLFDGQKEIAGMSSIDVIYLAYLICRGGWPKSIHPNEKVSLMQAYDYYDAVVESDISLADGVQRNPQRVKLLMRAYSRGISSEVKITSIRSDMISNDSDTLHEDTIYSYLSALKRIFVIEDLPAWSPNLRSKTAIRLSDKRHFVDPSIAVASLGIGPRDLINDLKTMGLLFESMCVRDLRVYAEAMDGTLYHYRDKSGLECDAVLHLRNGSYALIEMKLGGNEIDQAAKNLISLRNKIDTHRMKLPSFMMVLTGGSVAYRRKDGVFVIPATCLKD